MTAYTKKLYLSLCLLLLAYIGFAQQDTSSYYLQRNKINTLLAERSHKFGQYDESLNLKTGIFGWQTRKDIKNSNEILRAIVLNDNNIFKELKVLMDYKDLQKEQVAVQAQESTERNNGYMLTIKKLQDQNEKLRNQVKSRENIQTSLIFVIVCLGLTVIAGGYIIYKKTKPGFKN